MIDAKPLLSDLQKLLKQLEDDIRRRCEAEPAVDEPLRKQYQAARDANPPRTAQAYEVWREDQITQAAVAWILSCVFVRFCEDNHLIDPPRLAGPGERLRRAEDEHTLYFQKHPAQSDRDYLLWVFEQVAQLPAMKELFDHRHNPLWSIQLSGDGAMALLAFFQRRDPATGLLAHDFTHAAFVADPSIRNPRSEIRNDSADPTRFLGDLYQDLSESARKKYALLQTPIFVEEFILDRTLEPAIREFGFQQVRMIDPTCGSGHFLLGGFRRLFDLWVKHEPKTNVRELAQRALGQVYGVDLNPYAVAIARFRLLVAALRACDIKRLADAPGFTINLAAGDSLLHGPRPDVTGNRQLYLHGDDPLAYVYDTEDAPLLLKFLGQQYHAVVGNPPYITPKDKALNDEYRRRFGSCHRKYSLAVPFFQRFFDLALANGEAGFVGMITSNSFMKREFGKKLIEEYLPRWNLTHVIDTAGAYIPGHGTPTVILFGRNRRPASSTVRAVMGIRGEPATPDDPARGLVWSAILAQVDQPGSQSDFISVADTQRESFHRHPWSIGGGGAADLKEFLDEEAEGGLENVIAHVGFMAITGEDELFVFPVNAARRFDVPTRPFGIGDAVRDWAATPEHMVLFPYRPGGELPCASLELLAGAEEFLWPCRTGLRARSMFNKTMQEHGFTWYEYIQFIRDRAAAELTIVFAFVATHNHFVLDHGGKVFNRSAPVIKLPADASLDQHQGLLGLLNSSVACFWMKQVFHNKGSSVDQAGARQRTAPFEDFWEHDGTKLKQFPLSAERPLVLARLLDEMSGHRAGFLPAAVLKLGVPTPRALDIARAGAADALGRMIAAQEELDWECYKLYGLIEADLRYTSGVIPAICLGQRAFEIVLARQMAAGEVETTWFERHGSTPITEIPADWPEDYKQVVRRRIEIIEKDRNIALIERPEYKRRWNTEPWEEMQERALRAWLLDRLEGWPVEDDKVTGGQGDKVKEAGAAAPLTPSPAHPVTRSLLWDEREPRVMSVARLADRVGQNNDFMQVAALYRGRDDFDVTKLVAELVEDEAVPFLPILRYKESGLRNRRVWEQVWEMQREEDRINAEIAGCTDQSQIANLKSQIPSIPVPPKYKSADMLPGPIWRLRGKLDVPKERFVSFPHCQRDADTTLAITWAGFDHLQQMQALAAYYMDAKEREAWPADRRVPLLAGMLELLPWVLQWHNDLDEDHQLRMGDYYREFINDEAREMGRTTEQIRAWRPAARSKRGRSDQWS